ncbi:transposase [Bacillus sp. DJP31]|uniref:transposase n=1 Tax=Bacillus sp. DJP31 TaxID=3409789 RepID=UPI003BB6EF65
MVRKKRIWDPTVYYHVVSRGNRRDALFLDNRDFTIFMYILQEVNGKTPFNLASYCIMTNHFHLQLNSTVDSTSKIVGDIKRKYAQYYNNRYRLSGYVYDGRFYSKEITSPQGMLEVSRYIHLNPLKAYMIETPEQYAWSSYKNYKLGYKNPPFLDSSPLTNNFSGSSIERMNKYLEYVQIDDEIKRISFLKGNYDQKV